MKRREIGVYIYCFLLSPFMSDKCILFLLFFLPFFFWTVHFFTILTDKRYAVSFFCCLTQLIALIGYGAWKTTCLILKGDFSYETVQNILKTNLVICIGVFIISMVSAILHRRKQDTITMGLSLFQTLCYLGIMFIYASWFYC